MIAITRPVSASLARCELTHITREPIDVMRAIAQHSAYEALLDSLGADIVRAPAAPLFPDAVFVEDIAIVLDEVAVMTCPGAKSRRGESDGVAAVLREYRSLVSMRSPATLDGGDVLRLDRTLFVGRSSRTTDDGIAQLRALVAPHDYEVVAVEFSGCLHLKSAVTAIGDWRLLLNPGWVPAAAFPGAGVVEVDPGEPHGANALLINDAVVHSSQFPRTGERLVADGLRVEPIDYSEFAKAEGGVTCCSLILDA